MSNEMKFNYQYYRWIGTDRIDNNDRSLYRHVQSRCLVGIWVANKNIACDIWRFELEHGFTCILAILWRSFILFAHFLSVKRGQMTRNTRFMHPHPFASDIVFSPLEIVPPAILSQLTNLFAKFSLSTFT